MQRGLQEFKTNNDKATQNLSSQIYKSKSALFSISYISGTKILEEITSSLFIDKHIDELKGQSCQHLKNESIG